MNKKVLAIAVACVSAPLPDNSQAERPNQATYNSLEAQRQAAERYNQAFPPPSLMPQQTGFEWNDSLAVAVQDKNFTANQFDGMVKAFKYRITSLTVSYRMNKATSDTLMSEFDAQARRDRKRLFGQEAPPETTEESGKAKKKLSLELGIGGHYFLDSEVNGNAVTFVIDTGASMVSLPNAVATKAELSCRSPIAMQTANGLTSACTTVIDKLKLGDFLMRNVDAMIVPNLAQALLGMNVLQRFSISQEGGGRMWVSER